MISKNQIKVIHVLNHFLPEKYAGTEVYVKSLCQDLLAKNIISKVLIPNYGKDYFDFYIYDEISVCKYPETSLIDRNLILGFRSPNGLSHFISYLETEAPSIVHFHEIAGSNGVTLSHIEAARKIGLKVVITLHVVGYSCKSGSLIQSNSGLCNGKIGTLKCSKCFLNSKLDPFPSLILSLVSNILDSLNVNTLRLQNKLGIALSSVHLIKKHKKNLFFIFDNSDLVVVLNEWYKDILLSNHLNKNKIRVINQGLPHSNMIIKKNLVNSDCLRLVYVGRICFIKGVHILVDAILKLPNSKVELYIYGSSDDFAYEANLKHLTLFNSNIHWMGRIKPDDVINIISQFDALCLCSVVSEMSPLVIQEANAAGIPVIASNVQGNAAFILHEFNGLLFEVNNTEQLRKLILKCLLDKELLLRLAKNIQIPRSFDKVGTEYIDLYNSLF